jgi:tyrosine-protein kinase Etk/Wzc
MELGRLLPSHVERAGLAIQRAFDRYVPAMPVVEPAGGSSADWQRYLVAVARHKWIVMIVTALGTVAGVVATRMLEPKYSAKAILWIESAGRGQNRDVISGEEIVEASGWTELVKSNAVLDSVVRRLRLYIQPRSPADSTALSTFHLRAEVGLGLYRLSVDRAGQTYSLGLEDGTVIERGMVGDSVGASVGFAWAPPVTSLLPGRQIEFALTAPSDATQHLARELKVRLDPGGNFLRIELKGDDPARTAATVNAVAQRVVVVAAELKRERFQELARILGGQYEHAEQALQAAEEALRDFRVRNAGRIQGSAADAVAGRDPLVERSLETTLALEQARRDRRTLEEVIRDVPRAGLRLEALATVASVRQSPQLARAIEEATEKQAELRALRNRYTEESAPVQQLRSELATLEQRTIPELVRQLVAELSGREGLLASSARSALGTLRQVPSLALEEERLRREVATTEELATQVRQRFEAAQLALISSLPDLRILDAARTPHRPMGDYGSLLVALAFLSSLGMAVVGVTVLDRVDPRVRYPEQVTRGMRLPILGAIPHASAHSTGLDDAEVIEALRGLRVRVLHAHGVERPLLITVTSAAAGDGKSFVSVNLALSFAYAGYRTLLIDGDVRRGLQHRVLDAPRKPGLTDVLAGSATPQEAVRPTDFSGLSLLGSGTRMHRGPELLLSDALRDLMAQLRTAYGVVIVDSPPLSAGIDALVLGTVTRNLLFVLRSGTTDLPLALSKLDVVDALPVRPVGAVLNDVRGGDAFRYYTYDLSGYLLSEEESAEASRERRLRLLGGRS